MFLLMTISIMLNITFMFMNHPLSFGMILLFQTIIIALMTGLMNLNFWFSYIIFLIMIGAMLILFIYMTSIASNEKFKFSKKIFIMNFMLFNLFMFILIFLDSNFLNMTQFNYDLLSINNSSSFNFNLMKYLNFPNNNIFYLLILYLLLTLIMVVKITNIKSGPLRQK